MTTSAADTRADDLLSDLNTVYGGEGVCDWCKGTHDRHWFRPMDIGARDGSHHSATLARLVKRGAVLRHERGGQCRPAYMYRRAGAAICPSERKEACDAR